MIYKKDILARLLSLEEELGLHYHKADNNDDYNRHIVGDYGFMKNVKNLVDKKELQNGVK